VSLYLDASAILPILVEETFSATVVQFLQTAGEPLMVSDFAMAEVASGLSRRVRTGALELEAATAGLAHLDAWRAALTTDVDLQAADVRLANVFVRRFEFGLRAPDALHAAVCRRTGDTLVTLDRRLAAVAEALGVRVRLPAWAENGDFG
jgi:predicted nucleic acid-binding protein